MDVVEVLMSGGDGGGGVMEVNKAAGDGGGVKVRVGGDIEVDNKMNGSSSPVGSTAAAGGGGGGGGGGNNELINRWEKFLPKMMLRVLLVESDDSTRQIITALLRKCTFRVCAVGDGLKAWELLKGKAQNFDLILTEVDLPSISGFALLTLIMEHKICKNIPVIMMSSQDSVNTVYKCMLKGAADFLVKPVRKNELKNLWQHVWRRQASSSSGIGPPDESVAQQTLEATAENDGTSKCSSSDMVCLKRSREVVEKGSDDQSSCTKPESEVEGTKSDLPYSKRRKASSSKGLETNTGHNNLTKDVQNYQVGNEETPVKTGINSNQSIQQDTKLEDDCSRYFDATRQACEDNRVLIHSTREAIDLIGAFDKHIECSSRNGNSYDGFNMSDSLAFLDLSLKRSLPYGLTDHVTEERRSLNHSDASAFSRYVNKTPCPGHSKSRTPSYQLGNPEAILDNHFSSHVVNINSYPSEQLIIPPRSPPLTSDQPSKTENRLAETTLSLQNISTHESSKPPPFCTNSSMPQLQSSPDSVNHQETSLQTSFNSVNHQTRESLPSCNVTSNAADDDGNDQRKNKDKQAGHVSSAATDQCENSGFRNGNLHNLQGNESNLKLESLPKRECGIDDAHRVHVGDSLRSVQREAALMKFRLKRKDRCFEKKVRYESRKKLAEKRPRVKGQFVCQLANQQVPTAKSTS